MKKYEFQIRDYVLSEDGTATAEFRYRELGTKLWTKVRSNVSALMRYRIKENPALLLNTFISTMNSPMREHCPFKLVEKNYRSTGEITHTIMPVEEYYSYLDRAGRWISKWIPSVKYMRLVTVTRQ